VVGASGKIKIACVHAAALGEALKIKTLVEERLTVVESIIAGSPLPWVCTPAPARPVCVITS
jgi:hypothetical protein